MTVTTEEMPGTGDAAAGIVRLLLVDDHDLVIQGLAALLGDEPDVEVVGLVNTVESALAAARRLRPDVVIMDYRLPDGDGVDATRQLREIHPDANVIMLTASSDDSILSAALEAGCCGFVAKGSDIEELLRAVRAAASGGGVFASDIIARLVRLRHPVQRGPALSQREQEVLEMVADGSSTGAIALSLGLSQHTVRNHVRNLLAKLGAHSKLEAVVIGARENLISAPGQP